MINTLARTKNAELLIDVPIERLYKEDILWFWVDLESPTEDESRLLSDCFKFDYLAIEDCIDDIERPKVEYFDTYNFFIFHALNENTLEPIEVDLFVGKNYIVSFCKSKTKEIENVRQKILNRTNNKEERAIYTAYLILDEIVDNYFPSVLRIEDYINEIDIRFGKGEFHGLIDEVFDIRTDLRKLWRIVNSMKELLYMILKSNHLEAFKEKKRGFSDIYDHLLKLSDIIETNNVITAEIRDNYISINSHKMNKIMTVLTIVTSIFIPLTFISGIYGMNFYYMPELRWRYGYFYVLGIMAFISICMFLWFKRKGWFDIRK